MFRTHDADMLGLPGMFGAGQCQWHQVSRVLRTHWYHVTVQAKHEGRTTEVVLMIDSEPRLQQVLISQDDETIITDVQVVTPAHMNGTEGWRMEKLTKVTLGEDQNECVVCLLEVETGSKYHSSHQPDFSSDVLSNLRPIYRADMIRTH
ncbi:3-oxoacyl-ACP synthase, KASII [Pseudomonas chlororaphis subsp. aurantiaca]|nr:3-oxoacyl-ACP synthase, KASII [Pseudomonas chlororaphis subsp. aurantiaca]